MNIFSLNRQQADTLRYSLVANIRSRVQTTKSFFNANYCIVSKYLFYNTVITLSSENVLFICCSYPTNEVYSPECTDIVSFATNSGGSQ